MSKRLIIIIVFCFVFIYLAIVITRLPAKIITPFIPENSPIQLSKLSGSIWNGSAANLELAIQREKINLGKLLWQIKPFCFIKLHACIEIIIEPNGSSSGNISVTTLAEAALNQTLRLEKTNINIDANWLIQRFRLPISAIGIAELQAEYIEVKPDQRLPNISGTIRWADAGIDFPQEFDLGEYQLALASLQENEQNFIRAELSDIDGIVSTTGNIDIFENQRVQIDVNLRPTDQTPQDITAFLNFVGKKDRNGNFAIKQNTTINSIF